MLIVLPYYFLADFLIKHFLPGTHYIGSIPEVGHCFSVAVVTDEIAGSGTFLALPLFLCLSLSFSLSRGTMFCRMFVRTCDMSDVCMSTPPLPDLKARPPRLGPLGQSHSHTFPLTFEMHPCFSLKLMQAWRKL